MSLFRTKFAANVFAAVAGTAGAQLITISFTPLITRIYGPEALGILGIFMAVVATISPVAALSYPIAIVLPKSDSEAIVLVKASLGLGIFVALIAGIVCYVATEAVDNRTVQSTFQSLMYFVPAAIVMSVGLSCMEQWTVRKKLFRCRAVIGIWSSLATNSAKTISGLWMPSGTTLIVATVVGGYWQTLWLYRKAVRCAPPVIGRQTNGNIRKVLSRYKDFPLYRAPQILVNAFGQSAPIILLSALADPASAGLYLICRQVLGLPLAVIGVAVGDVFYQRITRAWTRDEELAPYIIKMTLAFLGIGVLPFLAIAFVGPNLFSLVFGAEWTESGEYARWLAIMALLGFANRPSVAAVPLLRIQRGLLRYEIISTIAKLAGLWWGLVLRDDVVSAMQYYGLLGALSYTYLILWVISVTLKRDASR